MRFLTFVFLFVPVSAIFAQQQHITYSSGQMTPEGRSRNYFEEAYKELEAMLEGRDSLDYERAVFLTENAYWDNQIAYSDFQNLLDLHTERIRKAANVIKETNRHKYESLRMFEKKNFNPLASNTAIYQYLTSPRIIIRDNRIIAAAPFRYSHDDPYGTDDWTNSQVLSLLNPSRREGNCYAWTALFKIFSERLKSEAYISTASHHVYIQHKDIKGGFYNIELPTRTFPGDGTIETLTYTTREGIMSGIAMRKLNLKESIGLCLIYLAKGYEYKFGESDAYFSLRCSNLALKHDSLNLNAMLLKAGVMEESLVNYMKKKYILEPEQLREIPEIKDVFIQYEKWINRLNTLGYREIPSDVQDILLAKARGEEISTYKDRTPDAFPDLDVQDVRYITLSNGLFDEVHVRQKYMHYGRTVLNTETGKIAELVKEDSLRRYKVDPVVFALSVDPLAVKYPHLNPYNFVGNMPINAIDPDGRDIIVLNDVNGAHGTGHQAVLIGNDQDGWTYVSKDGFKDGAFGSEPLYTVKTFRTIQEFANSSHNRVVDPNSPSFKPTQEHPNLTNSYDADGNLDANGKEGTKGGGSMDWNFYDTDPGSYDRKQRYDNAFYIKTDAKTDVWALNAAIGSASEEYCLANGDCSDVVTSALGQAKTRTGEKVHTGENTIPLLQGISIFDYFFKAEYPNQKQSLIEKKNRNEGYDADNLIVPTTK